MSQIWGFAAVFLGAGLGGMLRHAINHAAKTISAGFPINTLVVNIIGSFAMGLLVGYFATRLDPGAHWKLFLTTGLLGGFTTFSAFSLESVMLYERGALGLLALYISASVAFSILALAAGLFIMRQVYQG